MTENKISLREKYKDLLPIDNQDYIEAKKYYEKYLEIFDEIIKCENEEDLEKWKDPIIENNPWKEALEYSKQYRSIADSDRSILEPLIEEEINNLKKGGLTLEKIKTLQDNLRNHVEKALENFKETGITLNDYFKKGLHKIECKN